MAEIITRNLPVAAYVEEESKDLEPGDGEFMVISEKRVVSEKHNNATLVGTARNPFTDLFPDRHALKRQEEEMLEIMSMHFPSRNIFNKNKAEIKAVIIEAALSAEEQRILRKSEQYVRKMTFNPKIDELKEQRKKIMAKVNYKLRKLSNKLYGDR